MSTVHHLTPTQAAFINGFLGAPVVPKNATIQSVPRADSFQINAPKVELYTDSAYQATFIITNQGPGEARCAIRGGQHGREFPGYTQDGSEMKAALGLYTRVSEFTTDGDVVRTLALAVFPDFAQPDTSVGDQWVQRNRGFIYAKLPEVRAGLDEASRLGATPEAALYRGQKLAYELNDMHGLE